MLQAGGKIHQHRALPLKLLDRLLATAARFWLSRKGMVLIRGSGSCRDCAEIARARLNALAA